MKVKELKEILEELDPELFVWHFAGEWGWQPIEFGDLKFVDTPENDQMNAEKL